MRFLNYCLTTVLLLTLSSTIANAQYFVDFEGEDETKGAYGEGQVVLSGLSWTLSEALIGSLANDKKNGNRSMRMRRSGTTPSIAYMNEDKLNGIGEVSFLYARYGTETGQPTLHVEYSTNEGADWTTIGDPITDYPDNLTLWSFDVNIPENGRIRLRTDIDGTDERRLNIDDIQITDYLGTIEVNPSELVGFEQDLSTGQPSAEQSFDVSGFDLGEEVIINAPEFFEISLTSGGTFEKSITLATTDGELAATTVYVHLNGDFAEANIEEQIEITSEQSSTAFVTLKGNIIGPNIIVSTTSLALFTQTLPDPSGEQTFNVEAENLTSDLIIETVAPYEISLTSGADFGQSITLAPVDGEVALTQVFVRLNGNESNQEVLGEVKLNAADAAERIVSLTGEIIGSPTISITPEDLEKFTQYLPVPSSCQIVTIQGTDLADNIELTVSDNYEISLTGGTNYTNTLILEHVDGFVDANIYLRLNGATQNQSETGELTASSLDAATEIKNLAGKIVEQGNFSSIIIDFEGEGETKGSYNEDVVTLSGLDWVLNEVLIGTTDNDWKNGERAARLRGRDGSHFTLITPKENGLGNISFLYRRYGTDGAQQPWGVFYSNDGGNTWNEIGDPIVADETVRSFSKTIDVSGEIMVKIQLMTAPGETGDRRINIDDILLTDYQGQVYAEPNQLDAFTQNIGTPSTSQLFSVSGNDLIDDVVVEGSANFEVSLDDETFTESITIPHVDGTLEATTVYARLNGASPVNQTNEVILVKSTGAVSDTVFVEGEILGPELEVSVFALGIFEQIIGTPSESMSFLLTGIRVADDVVLTAPNGYEVALTVDGEYTSTLNFSSDEENEVNQEVFVRLNSNQAAEVIEGNLVISTTHINDVLVYLEGTTLCDGTLQAEVDFFDEYTLTATEEGYAYQWIDCDNEFAEIVGEEEMTYSPEEVGNYAVILTNTETNCADTSECVFIESVSLDEMELNLSVTAYPNPFTNEVTVESSTHIRSIQVLDALGKIILTKEVNHHIEHINTQAWKKGVYLIRIRSTSDTEQVLRVVK